MAPPARITRIAVVVPARDEERLIGACLRHLRRAVRALRRSHPGVVVDVVVVLDGCSDATGEIAERAGATTVSASLGNVGSARALGVAVALARAGEILLDEMWIASTDADTRVPGHWLTAQLALAPRADLVVGTVEPLGLRDDRLREAWRVRHTLAEGHEHVHGANLGVRASVYRAVGGYAALACGEDVDLVARVRAHTGRWVATDATRVASSARLTARLEGGFASYLADLARGIAAPREAS